MAVKRKRWEKTRREFWREYIRCGGTWDDIFDGDFKSEVIDRMDPLYKDLYDSNN